MDGEGSVDIASNADRPDALGPGPDVSTDVLGRDGSQLDALTDGPEQATDLVDAGSRTCIGNDTRTCDKDGLLGPCKTGTEKCNADGTWGPCSVARTTVDSCIRGDDSDCNGQINDNPNCICMNDDVETCGKILKKVGACATDKATCKNGQWAGCVDDHGPDTCDVAGNDNNCNGTVNEGCACVLDQTSTCAKIANKKGSCGEQVATCSGGQWTGCNRVPSLFDTCAVGNDDMCTGTAIVDPTKQEGFLMPNPASLPELPNPASYTFRANGTVLDNVTGLEWEAIPTVRGLTQPQAVEYCRTLTLAGGGWRLPNILELFSLFDPTVKAPDPFSTFPATALDGYWSSTVFPSIQNGRYVDFSSSGEMGTTHPLDTYSVRCVR